MRDETKTASAQRFPVLTRGLFPYVWLFVGLFVCFLTVSPFVKLFGSARELYGSSAVYNGNEKVRLAMAIFLFFLFIAAVVFIIKRSMTAEKALFIIILAGIMLRFGYMLYTPFYIRGHDIGSYDSYGHLAYVYRLFKTNSLPDSFMGQFYHPPFAHIADAVSVRLYALLTGQTDPDVIFQAAKLVPCFASCALLIVSKRLFNAFDFSGRAKIIAMMVLAFHPTFILLSASINNDMLMWFFFTAAFLYTVRWYQSPSYKNIILLAICIGCAMSTKFSGALIAFFTAAVFLIVLIRHMKNRQATALFPQFGAFALVCFPLGLWYYIRNLLLFGQPIGYVAQIGNDSALYIGDQPIVARFLSIDLPGMFKNVFCDPWQDVNLWEYTIKCALFGEFTFSEAHRVSAVILIASSFVLILLSLYAMIRFIFFDRKENRLAVLSLGALWLLLMLSFIYFNIKYPFGCTMDFRYIVPTVLTGSVFLGLLFKRLSESRQSIFFTAGFLIILTVFCTASVGFYIV